MAQIHAAAGVFPMREKDGKIQILFQKRGNVEFGSGKWSVPGAGGVEVDESFMAAARREAMEELGIEFDDVNIVFQTILNGKSDFGAFIAMILFIDSWRGELRVCECDKCECIEWFDIDKLPEDLWLPQTTEFIMNFKNKIHYSEIGWL